MSPRSQCLNAASAARRRPRPASRRAGCGRVGRWSRPAACAKLALPITRLSIMRPATPTATGLRLQLLVRHRGRGAAAGRPRGGVGLKSFGKATPLARAARPASRGARRSAGCRRRRSGLRHGAGVEAGQASAQSPDAARRLFAAFPAAPRNAAPFSARLHVPSNAHARRPAPIVDRPIRFALVGCGRIAQNHFEAIAPACRAMPNWSACATSTRRRCAAAVGADRRAGLRDR